MTIAKDGIVVHEGDTTQFGANRPYRGLEWRATHKPEYHIYLFNVSPRIYDPAIGTGFCPGRLGNKGIYVGGIEETDPSVNGLSVEGGDKSRKYHYVTSFPHPMLMSKPNLESNEMSWVETDGRRYVIDLINPDNLTLSLDTAIPPDQVYSVGNDYSRRGIFFDYQKIPSKPYMSAAVRRMESYFKNLLDVAAQLEMTDKPKLSQELGSNPDYAVAANYYGKDVAWNRMQVRPVSCPNCGEHKPAGRLFHMSSFGTLCVEQTLDAWRSAYFSGAKELVHIPPRFRVLIEEEEGITPVVRPTPPPEQAAGQ